MRRKRVQTNKDPLQKETVANIFNYVRLPGMPTLTSYIEHCSEGPRHCSNTRNINKKHTDLKGRNRPSLVA